MKQNLIGKRKNCKSVQELDANTLRELLDDANKDDKSEALKNLLKTLRPAMLELMGNKGWSSRRTARFFKDRGIKARACEIDAFIKANPFTAADAEALLELKRNISKTETKELAKNEKRI